MFHADRQTDRQTDMTKPQVAFRNFPKRLKMINNNIAASYHTSVVTQFILTSLKLADSHNNTLHIMSPYVITRNLQTKAFSLLCNFKTDHTL